MTRQEFIREYWRYYIHLENRFIQTLNYVELDASNSATFSNEYASLLQVIGSELDSFFKVYCGFPSLERKNIADYAGFVLTDYPGIISQEIGVYETLFTTKPFDGWNTTNPGTSLTWWTAYNNIKHSRITNKADASQGNVLNALSALFLIEMKLLSKITTGTNEADYPDEESSLFTLKEWNYRFVSGRHLSLHLDGTTAIIGG